MQPIDALPKKRADGATCGTTTVSALAKHAIPGFSDNPDVPGHLLYAASSGAIHRKNG
ncbi:MAG: hypothetical protein AAGC86_05090 [Pseudomonadota bacterium]